MFETVLVADRGVTAARVIRACERLGAQTIAVHGDSDARAPHARLADEAVPLGGKAFAETYGDTRKLLEAARRSGAEALHPGASVLALDAVFARSVLDAGLAWIGPPPDALERRPAASPGRRVTVVVRRSGGRAQSLGARERWGVVLDEHPAAPAAAADAALAAEQLVADDGLWAVDVAVEGEAVALGHLPVTAAGSSATSAVSGTDLAELELRLAAGDQDPGPGSGAGHALALQVRAAERFAGKLRRFRAPEIDGVRVDVAAAEGSSLAADADRLLAVVTVSGGDRDQALDRARRAVAGFEVAGVPTTLALLAATLDAPSFIAGAPEGPLLERISRT